MSALWRRKDASLYIKLTIHFSNGFLTPASPLSFYNPLIFIEMDLDHYSPAMPWRLCSDHCWHFSASAFTHISKKKERGRKQVLLCIFYPLLLRCCIGSQEDVLPSTDLWSVLNYCVFLICTCQAAPHTRRIQMRGWHQSLQWHHPNLWARLKSSYQHAILLLSGCNTNI